ncbi:hypothetical protein ACFZCP_35135 [Streptomyces sp. NPDC007971]|uniref:hypothetical protein n=1 Tax=Streptomyces sp. NPDC007971 TaxID=3364799 RepID=UPI0036E85DD8
MFGNTHRTSVWPTQGGRKYQYRCSCGASGYALDSSSQAARAGKAHEAKKKGR